MTIRKAIQSDSDFIANYLFLAMKDVVFFYINSNDSAKAINFLNHFIKQENNLYSYKNCWVVEQNQSIIAAVNLYDGAQFIQLRKPILDYIKKNINPKFDSEIETTSGEFYIDTLAVSPDEQGKGIATALLKFLINKFTEQEHKTLGLLVDEDNPNAKKLYQKLGFCTIGNKILTGKKMIHLQIKAL